MTAMNKKEKYAITGAVGVGIIAGVKNAFDQLDNRAPGQKFDWWQLIRKTLYGSAVGAVGGFAVGAICDYNNSLEKPLNTDEFLTDLAAMMAMHKNDPLYVSLEKKAALLIRLLKSRFPDEIKNVPYKYGSTEAGSALKDEADIDLCMECYPGSFRSTEEMYAEVEEYLKDLVGLYGIVKVRSQRVSIGVYFSVRGEKRKIDVTPKKLTYGTNQDTSGYLFVNRQGIFETHGRTKTDVQLLKSIKLTDTQRHILIVLKHLRNVKEMPISSPLLQMLIRYTYEAYRGEMPKRFTKKVLLVLQYIADNIESIVVKSPENTNNILTKDISSSDKALIRRICLEVINDFQYQPNSIIDHFDE